MQTFVSTLIDDPMIFDRYTGHEYIMDVTNGLNQESGALADLDRTEFLDLEVVLFPMFSANKDSPIFPIRRRTIDLSGSRKDSLFRSTALMIGQNSING